jgi:hypothetical protein
MKMDVFIVVLVSSMEKFLRELEKLVTGEFLQMDCLVLLLDYTQRDMLTFVVAA